MVSDKEQRPKKRDTNPELGKERDKLSILRFSPPLMTKTKLLFKETYSSEKASK